MKHVLKSLKHNGVYVPPYDYKGFSVKIQGQPLKLAPKSEQMAIAWIRKTQSTLSPPDKVFLKTFMQEFLEQLKKENPAMDFLNSFSSDYLKKIESDDANNAGNAGIDFSE